MFQQSNEEIGKHKCDVIFKLISENWCGQDVVSECGFVTGLKPLRSLEVDPNLRGFYEIQGLNGMTDTLFVGDLSRLNEVGFIPATFLMERDLSFTVKVVLYD